MGYHYDVSCENGHSTSYDPTGFEAFLAEGDFVCDECGKPLQFDGEEIILECHVCGEQYSADTLDQANLGLEENCGHCSEFASVAYHVPGSKDEKVDIYDWVRNGASSKVLKRKDRVDYWEGVIHFCTREEFVSIFEEMKIRASPTGKYKLHAVCLTETPSTHCSELKKKHGDYGYVFKKNELMKVGGNPVIYAIPSLIREFNRLFAAAKKLDGKSRIVAQSAAESIKPYITLLNSRASHPYMRRHDYLHEREWRVPHDIDLKTTKPFGVIIPKPSRQAFAGSDGDVVLRAAHAFEELEERDAISSDPK